MIKWGKGRKSHIFDIHLRAIYTLRVLIKISQIDKLYSSALTEHIKMKFMAIAASLMVAMVI